MPTCASKFKSAEACGDELYASAVGHMTTIVEAVHKVIVLASQKPIFLNDWSHQANPKAKVVGFGYDTMFGGLGCGLITRSLFPQCYLHEGGNACFNKEFLRIQVG